MGLLNVIRTLRLRHGLAIREIARRTGLSRNTIKKHLKAGTVEPQFATPERQSKLDPFADKLAGWLKTEAGKSRKQRRTMKQLHADLVALGFTGSYARVAAFARRWRADRQREQQTTGRGTFVPLHFEPGDAFQFDWSEDFAVLGGERTKLQMAHIKLSHSRAFLLRAYGLGDIDQIDTDMGPKPAVRIRDLKSGWPLWRDIVTFCEQAEEPLEAFTEDLDFARLDD